MVGISDRDCVTFLQWALPRIGLRWQGYRKVRGTVRMRLRRRLAALGLADLDAYRARLGDDAAEWAALERMCRIPISRFYRDRDVFAAIGTRVLPDCARTAQAAGRDAVQAWSAGCASGEEPYSLVLLWHHRLAPDFPSLTISVLATDSEPTMLARAARACYAPGSLRKLPAPWLRDAFEAVGDELCLRPAFRQGIVLRCADLRQEPPDGPFDLILCRYVAFTYFDAAGQRKAAGRLAAALRPGGWLITGKRESLPAPAPLAAIDPHLGLYRKEG